ncbi:TonB-dependent receptor [Paraglaciecola chathamensis]|uniref:TonB-dependent receptor n=1 Tax=Paraglaciecola chathamensis TaxID=368405 RepID=A0ABS0WI47_9ALTE|nr:TonB-dependent receptor [Paraglaciecola chathamensis]MBJ2138139.1 TonB-dependent receptor [Paraglaciecola chathamensis]
MNQFLVSKRTILRSAIVAALGAGCVAQANAVEEEATAKGQKQSQGIEEILITARKRTESLQETPLSVIAFGSEALEQQNVTNLTDLNTKLPNASIGGSGGLGGTNAVFSIRGLGTARNAVSQEQPVALYIDDAYYGRSDGALLSVLDVERVEVLRGPQGTLFGRNATGGAIRYITKKPHDTFEAKVKASIGSFNRTSVSGDVNLPVSDDSALKLTVASTTSDGYVENKAGGHDVGDEDTRIFRAQWLTQATDDIEIVVSGDYSKTDTNGAPSVTLAINPESPLVQEEAAAGFDATLVPVNDYYETYATGQNFNDTESVGGSITVNWAMETMDFISSTNYRNVDIYLAYDADGTPASLFEQIADRDITMFSQEFRLSGLAFDERMQWTAGVFYYDEEASDIRDVLTTMNARPATAANTRGSTRVVNPVETTSIAIFGQMTYDVTDDFSVTTGLRYTEDEKDIFASERAFTSTEFISATDNHTWDAVTGRISAEYQLNDEIFAFASFARGYRAGSFNDRIRTNLDNNGVEPYDEEILDNIETGIRSDLLDGTLRLNLTAFYSDYQDLQLTAPVLNSVPIRTLVQNAGQAEIKGLEGEFIWLPADNFRIDGAFGYLDFEFTEVAPGITQITTDSEAARAPKYSFTLGAQYNLYIDNGSEVLVRADYGWKDDYKIIVDDNLQIIQEAFGLLGINVSYITDDWRVSVYGTNLTDEEYALGGLGFVESGGAQGFDQIEPGRPREFGVSFQYEW